MADKAKAVRALVVDYTPQIVNLIRAVLHTMNGIDHIDSTGRGDVAADLLRGNDYDLVVIEAVVPFGDERLLAHIARQHPSVRQRTIVITAPPMAPEVLRDIAAVKPHTILAKPFDVVAFADVVHEILPPVPRRIRPQHAA
ncbi:MAG TPA: hypothetical protein VGQ36_15910 [Thermoanaerobaculia bacterium]|jgi:DNA-binding NarL/FixJ family response regulator|nr:hypothetical protein [Thermoanaerobaculia bacterium]